jgi:hypothetical protein
MLFVSWVRPWPVPILTSEIVNPLRHLDIAIGPPQGRYLYSTAHNTYLCGHRRVYPNVSGLVAWSENCKWYSSLPLSAVVSLFCASVY